MSKKRNEQHIRSNFFSYPKDNVVIVDMAHYVRMYTHNPDSVKGARLVPPVIGEEDFGHFEIPTQSPMSISSEEGALSA